MEIRDLAVTVDGFSIAGEVYIPSGDGRFPALCICHGIPAAQYDPSDLRYAQLAKRFCESGFATAIFNFRGAGRSGGNLDILGWMRDLKAVVKHVDSLDTVDSGRLGLMGSSAGGAVAACVAAEEKRVSFVVLMASPADFSGLVDPAKAKPFVEYLRKIGLIRDNDFPIDLPEWARGFGAVSPVECIGRISPRPVLILHGDKDDTVPLDHAQRLFEAAGDPKELVILPGAGHRLRLDESAVSAAQTWLHRVIRR
ncbi:MAG: alpha/beta fold hydrolase [Chloroflexota bacterium]